MARADDIRTLRDRLQRLPYRQGGTTPYDECWLIADAAIYLATLYASDLTIADHRLKAVSDRATAHQAMQAPARWGRGNNA
jgi:hypothetical protein